jgi:hypothetical protein
VHEEAFNSLIECEATNRSDTHPEQGDSGIDRFGHFAGLTAAVQMKQTIRIIARQQRGQKTGGHSFVVG